MTDPLNLASALPPDPVAPGAGAALRSAREAHRLTLEQVAERLKVSVHKLAALEADREELLSDPVYTRALAASVCRLLKIEAEPILALLPRSKPSTIRADDAGLNTQFRSDGHAIGGRWSLHDRTSLAIAVLVLLAAALAIVIWPRTAAEAPAATPLAAAEETSTALPVQPAATQPTVAPAPVAAPEIVPSAAALPEPVPQTEVSPPAPVLTLVASGASWVRVTDAKGVEQLHRTLQAGERVTVAGELPLSVVLGRADLVAVTVRNQPFDLSAVTISHVARFEVK